MAGEAVEGKKGLSGNRRGKKHPIMLDPDQFLVMVC